MKIRSISVLGLAGALVISACSSDSGADSAKKQNTSNAANSETVAMSNGDAVPGPRQTDANLSASNTNGAIPIPNNSVQNKMESMRKAGTGPDLDAAEFAAKNAKPAPDNSTFASYLTDAGYEIRTFKNHPQLLKVEKKTAADGAQSIKIFLRNGKVVEVAGGRINPLSTAPAAFILDVAGVQPMPVQKPVVPAGPVDLKKPGI